MSMYSNFVLGFSCKRKDISAPVLNSVGCSIYQTSDPFLITSLSSVCYSCLSQSQRYLQHQIFWGEVSLTPNPQPRLPAYPFSPMASPTWDTLPVVTLLPA
jgi:hypothetical protein